MLPEGLDERFRDLRRRPTARASLRADRERAVEQIVFGTGKELWIPAEPLGCARNEAPPRRVERPREGDALAGLDADGRPVLVRDAFGLHGEPPAAVLAHPGESADTFVIGSRLLTWDGSRLEIVGFLTHRDVSHVTWIDYGGDGRPVRFATAGVAYNALGKGGEVAWCEWRGPRCMAVRKLRSDERGRWHAELRAGDYDADGLVRVRGAYSGRALEPDSARAALAALEAVETIWDRARDGADADPLPPADALAIWVDAVAAAARRVVGSRPASEPFLVKVLPSFHLDEEPYVVVADRAHREAIAGRVDAREAVNRLRSPEIPLLPELDEAGRRAWRSLRQARVDSAQPAAAEMLQRRLAEGRWPNDALPMVFGMGADPWQLAARVMGQDRVDGLLALFPPLRAVPRVESAPGSRDDLLGLLRAFGLPEQLADGAEWGIALLPRGRGRSRLGGRPDLPTGTPWPTSDGRALTHLATIVLSELPAIEGRDRLPADGSLSFFADLTEEGELWEPVVAGEDDRVRIVGVSAGEETYQPEPPEDDRDEDDVQAVLRQRRIRFAPVLTIPEVPTDLSPGHRILYERLYDALLEVTLRANEPGHLMLGHPAVVQEDPREPGQVNVLHIGYDEALGFEFLDAADLTFFGDADDVAAERWERLTVSPDSH
jgi:hypothetical protein